MSSGQKGPRSLRCPFFSSSRFILCVHPPPPFPSLPSSPSHSQRSSFLCIQQHFFFWIFLFLFSVPLSCSKPSIPHTALRWPDNTLQSFTVLPYFTTRRVCPPAVLQLSRILVALAHSYCRYKNLLTRPCLRRLLPRIVFHPRCTSFFISYLYIFLVISFFISLVDPSTLLSRISRVLRVHNTLYYPLSLPFHFLRLSLSHSYSSHAIAGCRGEGWGRSSNFGFAMLGGVPIVFRRAAGRIVAIRFSRHRDATRVGREKYFL